MAHLLYTRRGARPEDTKINKTKPLPSRTSERSGGEGADVNSILERMGVHCTVGRDKPRGEKRLARMCSLHLLQGHLRPSSGTLTSLLPCFPKVLGNMVSAVAPSLIVSLLLLLRALPLVSHSVPLQATLLEDMVGSGEAEDSSASSPSLPPPGTPALSPTSVGPQPTPLAGPKPPINFLDGIVDFFRQYVMLIAVVGSLVFLLMFIVCAALITRQKHKASAYYPSSFPKKKYVDQSDRAGGPQAFSEVPDKDPDGRSEEALDSSQQLQADILAATQNLKSPARVASGSGNGAKVMEGKLEEEEKGSQEADQEAEARGVPEERAEVPEDPCSAGVEGSVVAGEGPGEPEAAPSLSQEAEAPASPPESPCACGSISPSV